MKCVRDHTCLTWYYVHTNQWKFGHISTSIDIHDLKYQFRFIFTPNRCNYGYVAIDEEGRPDARVFKERYCGPYLPPDTSSKNSRLVLIFNTDNAREGRGFSALYEFIPGMVRNRKGLFIMNNRGIQSIYQSIGLWISQ